MAKPLWKNSSPGGFSSPQQSLPILPFLQSLLPDNRQIHSSRLTSLLHANVASRPDRSPRTQRPEECRSHSTCQMRGTLCLQLKSRSHCPRYASTCQPSCSPATFVAASMQSSPPVPSHSVPRMVVHKKVRS